jgi:YD repeat-containing protein
MKTIILAATFAAPILFLGPATYAIDHKAQLSGKTVTKTNAEGQRYTETYHSNGTLSAISTFIGGGCCMRDTGKWWIEGDQLCRQYDHWRGGAKRCAPI